MSDPLPWVNGIPDRPGAGAWQRYLADQVLGRAFAHGPRRATHVSQSVLGIPHSLYWFVGICHEMYEGAVVAEWDVIGDLAAANGGLCPFDSGGLAHGHFV